MHTMNRRTNPTPREWFALHPRTRRCVKDGVQTAGPVTGNYPRRAVEQTTRMLPFFRLAGIRFKAVSNAYRDRY